ncbi:fimbria/pilus outer membrane usher protein [Providencia stuartii]|uniref:fimbria/pilus outer membrane usher protein n=1 Tax=Providencia stuartii TaxID=588 RepID=UPI0027EE2ABB|nr:fimbria/pilus outer membrane usher protein [Providencia stuartii]MDQ5992364.1 fimbria/pilus outer membrane usher protein [Providencia stuartii]
MGSYIKFIGIFFLLILNTVSFDAYSLELDKNELYFPPSLISSDDSNIADLSVLERMGSQLPSYYYVDVYLNEKFKFKKKIRFIRKQDCFKENNLVYDEVKNNKDETGLYPVLDKTELNNLGIKTNNFITENTNGKCLLIEKYIHDSFVFFDFQNMKINISVPQIAVSKFDSNDIPTSEWDDGINALFTSYYFDYSNNKYKNSNSKNFYLNLRSGINYKSWRFRDNRTWTKANFSKGGVNKWQYLNSYMEKSIIPLRTNLIVGDSGTNNAIFDTINFRGIQLETDESMYSSNLQGFSPVIKGVAYSNATVKIYQNGYLINQISVSPGPFEISDLSAMSSSGDLYVNVIESDGSMQEFTVPYATVPILLREGRIHYSLTIGKYRSDDDITDQDYFGEGTFIWGSGQDLTLYGGGQYSKNYLSEAIGVGVNLGIWGALSTDIINSSSRLVDKNKYNGQSLRFLYARAFPNTGTNIQLTGYRYSTKGFYTLRESMLKYKTGTLYKSPSLNKDDELEYQHTGYFDLNNNRKEKIQVTLSQDLNKLGSVYISAIRQSYWGIPEKTLSLQSGVNGNIADFSYNLSFNLNESINEHKEKITDKNVFLSVNIPLQKWLPQGGNSIYASYNINHNNDGDVSQQISIGGNALTKQNLSWNISQGYSDDNSYNNNTSLMYQGAYGNYKLGYGYGNDYTKSTLGISGGITVFDSGIIFSQPLGETNALISAPDASSIPIENASGVETDWRGYTIKPYLTPYRLNNITLDSSKLDDKTEIESGSVTLVPTRGALVHANFITRHGDRALIKLTKNGTVLPFGSLVSVGNQTSIVGDDGQVYLSGLKKSGKLIAKWGNSDEDSCTVNYNMPNDASKKSIVQLALECI